MDLEVIYHHLPRLLQNMAIGVQGSRIDRRRYGGAYSAIYKDTVDRDNFSVQELETYREKCLKHLFQSANSTKYWKEKFSKYQIDIKSSNPFSELNKLPVLMKKDVRGSVNDISNSFISRNGLMTLHTSGTTGSGLVFPATLDMEKHTWATWWRYRGWHGITKNMWCGYFGGRSVVPVDQNSPPYWRFNKPGKQLLFSAYHLSGDTVHYYVETIKKTGVKWLHGYPSLLSLVAKYILEMGVRIDTVDMITIGAENLLETQKNVIQDAFNAPVFQHYGQAEGVANISECPNGVLHVDEDYSGVEFILVEGQPEKYQIIGTGWCNTAFPLFRYDTGDIATIKSDQQCNCGRLGRVVHSIDGRKEDYITLPNGVKIGRLDHVFKDLVNIREAQIHQRSLNNIDVLVVRDSNYSNVDEHHLLSEFDYRLGGGLEINIRYVDRIPRSKSGKLRFVVSDI